MYNTAKYVGGLIVHSPGCQLETTPGVEMCLHLGIDSAESMTYLQ